MLTAKTKSGKRLCLGYGYKKETLLNLRSKEIFVCQVCGEEVILKIGEQKIYHFAHKKSRTCLDFFENETEAHMNGKLQLFGWLKRQRIPVQLEYYDRKIKQRPDILFFYNGKKYALEYQCSTIPEKLYLKRTENYLQNDYIPLWILGGNQYNEKGNLSNFHYLFLRKASNKQIFIPYYFPENNLFLFQHSIFPYSTKKAFFQKNISHIDDLNLLQFFEPHLFEHYHLQKWKEKIEYYKLQITSYPNPKIKSFFNLLYENRLNLFLLPVELGLPVSYSFSIQTSVLIWQTYLYLDVFKFKKAGDFVKWHEIEHAFSNRIKKGDIKVRSLFVKSSAFKPVLEYLELLSRIGLLVQISDGLYQVRNSIKVPKTNKEYEEGITSFYAKNAKLLMKPLGKA